MGKEPVKAFQPSFRVQGLQEGHLHHTKELNPVDCKIFKEAAHLEPRPVKVA